MGRTYGSAITRLRRVIGHWPPAVTPPLWREPPAAACAALLRRWASPHMWPPKIGGPTLWNLNSKFRKKNLELRSPKRSGGNAGGGGPVWLKATLPPRSGGPASAYCRWQGTSAVSPLPPFLRTRRKQDTDGNNATMVALCPSRLYPFSSWRQNNEVGFAAKCSKKTASVSGLYIVLIPGINTIWTRHTNLMQHCCSRRSTAAANRCIKFSPTWD